MKSLFASKSIALPMSEHTERYSDFYNQTKAIRFFNSTAVHILAELFSLAAILATFAVVFASVYALFDATVLAHFLGIASITQMWAIMAVSLIFGIFVSVVGLKLQPLWRRDDTLISPAMERAVKKQMAREDRLLGWRPREGAAHPKGRDDTYNRLIAYKRARPGYQHASDNIANHAHYEIGILVYRCVTDSWRLPQREKIWIVDSARDKQLFALGDEESLKQAFDELQIKVAIDQEKILQEAIGSEDDALLKQAIQQGQQLADNEQYALAQRLVKII